MKSRTIVGIIAAAALLFPAIAPAATTADLNTQLLATLQQLIQVLEAELQQLLILHQNPNPIPPPTPIPPPSTSSVTLSASPTSGQMPLVVNFTSNVGGSMNFGDGTSATLNANPMPQYRCAIDVANSNCVNPTATFSTSHTYTSVGTYTATLTQGNCVCPAGGVCNCPAMIVGASVAITVSSTSTQTSAIAPMITSLSPMQGTNGTQVTVSGSGFTVTGNTILFGGLVAASNASANASGTQLTFTVPQSLAPNCQTGQMCPQFMELLMPGTFQLSVQNANGTSNAESFTVTGSSIGIPGIPPTVSAILPAYPTSGPAPLGVNFWYALPNGSADGYTINYGDGSSGTTTIGCAVNPLSGTNACPFGLVASHTYLSAGTYTATLRQGSCACPTNGICNCPAIINLASATVTVGGGTTTGSSCTYNGTTYAAGSAITYDACVNDAGCFDETGSPAANFDECIAAADNGACGKSAAQTNIISLTCTSGAWMIGRVSYGPTLSSNGNLQATGGSCTYNGQPHANGQVYNVSTSALPNYLICVNGQSETPTQQNVSSTPAGLCWVSSCGGPATVQTPWLTTCQISQSCLEVE